MDHCCDELHRSGVKCFHDLRSPPSPLLRQLSVPANANGLQDLKRIPLPNRKLSIGGEEMRVTPVALLRLVVKDHKHPAMKPYQSIQWTRRTSLDTNATQKSSNKLGYPLLRGSSASSSVSTSEAAEQKRHIKLSMNGAPNQVSETLRVQFLVVKDKSSNTAVQTCRKILKYSGASYKTLSCDSNIMIGNEEVLDRPLLIDMERKKKYKNEIEMMKALAEEFDLLSDNESEGKKLEGDAVLILKNEPLKRQTNTKISTRTWKVYSYLNEVLEKNEEGFLLSSKLTWVDFLLYEWLNRTIPLFKDGFTETKHIILFQTQMKSYLRKQLDIDIFEYSGGLEGYLRRMQQLDPNFTVYTQ